MLADQFLRLVGRLPGRRPLACRSSCNSRSSTLSLILSIPKDCRDIDQPQKGRKRPPQLLQGLDEVGGASDDLRRRPSDGTLTSLFDSALSFRQKLKGDSFGRSDLAGSLGLSDSSWATFCARTKRSDPSSRNFTWASTAASPLGSSSSSPTSACRH